MIQQVIDLRSKGYKAAEIAEAMGLSYGAVRGELQVLQAVGRLSERKRVTRYIPAEGDPNWSVQQPCTEDNLRTLLAALRRIDLEAGNDE